MRLDQASVAPEAVVTFAVLCGAFTLKHYLADFVFQTNWIARGKERVQGWFLPLCVHVLSHAVLTLAIALVVVPALWWVALADLGIHFVVDRGKSLASQHTHWNPGQIEFWWLLGFDQFLHQITNVALAVALLLL